MEPFAVVIIGFMQPRRNDGYVGPINRPYDIRNLVEVMELLCEYLHNVRKMPSDEFL
jgi:hypothetical protein